VERTLHSVISHSKNSRRNQSCSVSPASLVLRFPLLREALSFFIAGATYSLQPGSFCRALLEVGSHCPVHRLTPHGEQGQKELLNHTLSYFRCICRKSNIYQDFQLSLKTPGDRKFTILLENVTLYLIFFPLKKLCLTSGLIQLTSVSHLSLLSSLHCVKTPCNTLLLLYMKNLHHWVITVFAWEGSARVTLESAGMASPSEQGFHKVICMSFTIKI